MCGYAHYGVGQHFSLPELLMPAAWFLFTRRRSRSMEANRPYHVALEDSYIRAAATLRSVAPCAGNTRCGYLRCQV